MAKLIETENDYISTIHRAMEMLDEGYSNLPQVIALVGDDVAIALCVARLRHFVAPPVLLPRPSEEKVREDVAFHLGRAFEHLEGDSRGPK